MSAGTTMRTRPPDYTYVEPCQSCGRPRYKCALDPCRHLTDRERTGALCACGCEQPVPASQTYLPDHDVPRVCACGCDEPINQRHLEAVRLKRAGWSHRAIAERVGGRPSSITALVRQVARFKKGHVARTFVGRKWEERTCRYCGRAFKTTPTSTKERCSGFCPALSFNENIALNHADFDTREAARNAILRARYAVTAGVRAEEEAQAQRRRALIKKHGVTLPPIPVPDLDGELAELAEEQRKDARREQVQFAPSLDAWREEEDDGSYTQSRLGAVCFDRDDDEWAYRAARGVGRKVRAHR